LSERLLDIEVVAWSTLMVGCARFCSGVLAFFLFMEIIHLDLEIEIDNGGKERKREIALMYVLL